MSSNLYFPFKESLSQNKILQSVMSVCDFTSKISSKTDSYNFVFLTYVYVDHLLNYAMRKTYLYIPRTVRSTDKRRAREAKFYFDPFGRLEDGRNLQRVSSQLSTLRGNVAYYFSQLHQ